ncbi:MAG: ABC transporter ATP-binding protein [Balneolaceae bacterium]|nr:ABC transporter ATP-binding protein [Balneolaceae bacterium]
MIELKGITKSYGDEPVLKEISFTLPANSTLSILGKSGSGKTTLLKIVAGLTGDYTGSTLINGKPVDDVKPKERGIVYLYQEPLLFPHLSVFENICFGLRIRKEIDSVIREKTNVMIKQLGLEGHESKYPGQLSGGQKQRVAFGRAFIIHPRVLLLDEPFGSLDSETRREMQKLFTDISKTEKITTLFVTHDLKEALVTGDHFGMIVDGRLRIYNDKQAFIDDAETGVKQELTFWKKYIQ